MGGDRASQGYLAFFRSEWRFLSFGIALTFLSGFGQSYYLSVFKEPWQAELGLSHLGYGLCYGIATGASAIVVVWIGRHIDTLDLRLWTFLVVFALAVACGIVPFAATAILLTVALFAMRLTGQGMMTHTAFTSMGRYFEHRRGKAMSLTGLGFAAGFAVFPKVGDVALRHFTWREVWWLGAGFVACVGIPLAMWLLKGQAARHAQFLARQQAEAASSGSVASARKQWTRSEVVRDVRFWAIQPLTLACPFIMTGLIILYAQIAREKGWSASHLPESMVALAITQYLTALVMGTVVDRVGALRLVAFTQLPLALGLAVLAVFDHPVAAPVYLGLVGLTMGSMSPVVGSVYPELYGVMHLGSIRSLTSSLMVVSTAIAPLAMGALVDHGVDMETIAWLSVGHIALATVLVVWVFRRSAVSRESA